MKILVCVKHVPDLASTRAFTPSGLTEREPFDSTLNEVDENAVEAALALAGEGDEIVALTVGPAGAADAVRRALQMGVTTAVHVSDDALAGLDAPATARVLAAAARSVGEFDLVLMGMTALDGLGSVVPAMLGHALGVPALVGALRLDVSDGVATIRRDLDGVREELSAPLPVVVSVSDDINSPRLPKTKDILAARSKPISTLALADLGEVDVTSTTAVRSAVPAPPREDPVIIHDDGTGGRKLAEYLIAHDLTGVDR